MSKPDDIPQDVWDMANAAFLRFPATGLFTHPEAVEVAETIARLVMAERSNADEMHDVLKDVVAALRKDAPGTPLNNRKYDHLGIRAYAAIRKHAQGDAS